jgi:hypothetical protein
LSEGRDFPFIDWIFPDMKWGLFGGTQNATIQIFINAVDYPNDTPEVFGPFNMTDAVQFINTRVRNRMISLTFTSSDLGSFWRLGGIRIRTNPMGRR